jgi:PAS domain-containing protein
LFDAQGRRIGLIALLHRRPLAGRAVAATLLAIFAVRAAAEVERRAALWAAEASERSYRQIFDASEDAIFVHDWDTGAVLDVSPKAVELFGHSREALRQLRVADISLNEPPYTEREAAACIQRAKTHRAPLRFE